MTTTEEQPLYAQKPDEQERSRSSLLRSALSLLAFIGVYYWLFESWLQVAALVGTLLIHESGHFIAMKVLGYRAVNMMFIPLVGAYVSGTATRLSRRNKLLVLLAGPVPGMLLGSLLLLLHQYLQQPLFYSLAMPLLLLNAFNLLPIYPLDGGQFFQVLFYRAGRYLQYAFLILSAALLLWFFFRLHYNWLLLMIAALVMLRIRSLFFADRVRRQLDAEAVEYACSYDDLSDEAYLQIRNALIRNSRALRRRFTEGQPSEQEHELIPYVESILVPAFSDELSTRQQWGYGLVWLASLLLPFLLWWGLYLA